MLKIKNNVDLKELEKFGFIKYRSIEDGEMYYCIYNLFIGKDRRILQEDGINPCKSVDYQLSEIEIGIIYDLIQARISRKGVDMKVINFIEKIRDLEYKLTFEFRQENYFLKQEIVDNVYAIDLKLLDKEIDNWFVDFEKQMIVIDLEKE